MSAIPQARPRALDKLASRGAVQAFMLLSTIYFLAPVVWLAISSTKGNGDLFSTFGFWFAHSWRLWPNLRELFSYDGDIFFRWFANTLVYSGVGAFFSTLFAAMAGYALAVFRFPGRNTIFSVIIGSILVPTTALALPLYLLLSRVHLTNTYWAVLLPSCVSPFGVYLARIYAAHAVPPALLEAARIDGAGEFRIFSGVALRIMAPALVTIFLFQFVTIWNNLFLPLVMLSDPRLYPLTLGLQSWFVSPSQQNVVLYNLIVTGSLVSILPLIAAFLLLSRWWQSGLTAGSIVG